MSKERTEREELRQLVVDMTLHITGNKESAESNGRLLDRMVDDERHKAAASAMNFQRELMQTSLDEAVREVSERVWGEAVAACQDKAITACTSGGFDEPENPYTLEAIEKRIQEEGEASTD